MQKLSSPKIETRSTYDVAAFENVIKKFRGVQDEKRFLSKTIKEYVTSRLAMNKLKKFIYKCILETMLHEYLYDPNEQNSENDYLVKLYGPIMERGIESRRVSEANDNGEETVEYSSAIPEPATEGTKSKECKDNGFNCKIDLRVTTNTAKHIDLSAAEYAKKPNTSKHYTDKLKLVLSGFIHLRKYISSNNTTAELKSVPLMLVEGLEGESFILFLVDDGWLAIQKIDDTDIPNNVDSIKNRDTKLYTNGLNLFKPIWKSEFVDESSDDESIYFSKNFEIFLELR
ncbi:hypothetical protein G6F61_002186 [Rhizopus arrhizus]|nr:hypothetical protein G6F61_002186 [Rhizopus arrhizus]